MVFLLVYESEQHRLVRVIVHGCISCTQVHEVFDYIMSVSACRFLLAEKWYSPIVGFKSFDFSNAVLAMKVSHDLVNMESKQHEIS
jgi:hypothetical protein